MTTELVPKTITPSEIFVPHGLDPILAGVRIKVKKFKVDPLDMEKKKDRDKLRTFSADIARSKTFVDEKRKLFVKDKKAELKIIDQECKSFRDTMDEIKIDTREPLTTWEYAEKIRIEEERQFEIYLIEWDDAIAENDLFDRETIMCAKEAEIARAEEEKRQKEETERLKREQTEREERIKKEAAAQAVKDAEEKIENERSERLRIEAGAVKIIEQAELDRIAAKEKAEKDKQTAIQKVKDDAKEEKQRKKQQRLDREKAEADKLKKEKEIADRKAANLNHQKAVNRRIISAFTMLGISEKDGIKIIRAIVRKELPDIFIKY